MAEAQRESAGDMTGKRGRGAAKSFPTTTFRDTLVLAKGIEEHGFDGSIRRLTLFDKLAKSPESSVSRTLIANSSRYGLTSGGSAAEFLRITPEAAELFAAADGTRQSVEREFALAIAGVDVFARAYEHLKSKRIPPQEVFRDELLKLGVPASDTQACGEVLVNNLRALGLIQDRSGAERVIALDEILESLPAAELPMVNSSASATVRGSDHSSPVSPPQMAKPSAAEPSPSLHIDVQIHIDSSATSEQIDQIFASMARHLYGKQS